MKTCRSSIWVIKYNTTFTVSNADGVDENEEI